MKPKILGKLQVTISPCCFRGIRDSLEMKVEVRHDGQIHSHTEIIDEDYFDSIFDRIWDRVKYILDEELKKSTETV